MQFNTWKDALEASTFNTTIHWKTPISEDTDINMIKELFIIKFNCKKGDICCDRCGFVSYDKLFNHYLNHSKL